MNPALQIKPTAIPANGVVPVDISGSFLLFVSSIGTFNFSIDGGPFQPGLTIMSIDVARMIQTPNSVTPVLPDQTFFKRILLQDTSGAANSVTFIVANAPVEYINPVPTVTAVNAATKSVAWAAHSVPGNSTVQFAGNSGGTGKSRKQIIIHNRDNTNPITILDAVGNVADVLNTGDPPWTVELSGLIQLQNTQAAAVTVYVLEIYYT